MAGIAEEATIARVARDQHGMVSVEQLLAAGFGHRAISRRRAGGWLVRRHKAVYQVGVFPGPFGDEMAALLACGPEAVLCHRAATSVFEIAERGGRPVDVCVPGGFAGRRPGIRPHRIAFLPTCDVVVRHGLRVTTPARTLLDLAASTSAKELERLTEEALLQKLASPAELLAVLARGAGRPGVRKLRAIVHLLDEPSFTRSEAERLLLDVVRSAGLPAPRTNTRIAGLEVDALWPEHRLVVEVDGYAFHGTRQAFERDRRRDARLTAAGYRVIRLTWRQLTSEREHVIALLAAVLATRA